MIDKSGESIQLINWVFLPKELAFIVGYYESIGYILVLTDNSDNNKV